MLPIDDHISSQADSSVLMVDLTASVEERMRWDDATVLLFSSTCGKGVDVISEF